MGMIRGDTTILGQACICHLVPIVLTMQCAQKVWQGMRLAGQAGPDMEASDTLHPGPQFPPEEPLTSSLLSHGGSEFYNRGN